MEAGRLFLRKSSEQPCYRSHSHKVLQVATRSLAPSASNASRAAQSICSISIVTTSQCWASSRTAAASRKLPAIACCAICPAGESAPPVSRWRRPCDDACVHDGAALPTWRETNQDPARPRARRSCGPPPPSYGRAAHLRECRPAGPLSPLSSWACSTTSWRTRFRSRDPALSRELFLASTHQSDEWADAMSRPTLCPVSIWHVTPVGQCPTGVGERVVASPGPSHGAY
jgi:hypothetical protein